MDLSKHLVIFKPNVLYDDCLCYLVLMDFAENCPDLRLRMIFRPNFEKSNVTAILLNF